MVGAYGGHGGGDERLAADFVQFVRGEKPSLACTSIFDSVAGHLCVYLADESRTHGGQPVAVHIKKPSVITTGGYLFALIFNTLLLGPLRLQLP